MSIDRYRQLLEIMEREFHTLAGLIPPPVPTVVAGRDYFRFAENSREAAAIQKLARTVSGLHAVLVLLEEGLYQEVGVMYRVLDEINQDIWFLTEPLRGYPSTRLHDEYLASFYEEELEDPSDPLGSRQSRSSIARQKIQARLARAPETPANPSDVQAMLSTIYKAYSGYVHAASQHVLEMYGADPPHFMTSGMRGTPREREFVQVASGLFVQSLASLMLVAKCFGQPSVLESLRSAREDFGRDLGLNFAGDPEEMFRNLRKNNRRDGAEN